MSFFVCGVLEEWLCTKELVLFEFSVITRCGKNLCFMSTWLLSHYEHLGLLESS